MKIFWMLFILTGIIVLGIYFPIARWIMGIGVIIVVGLIIILFRGLNNSEDFYLKNKFGDNYKYLISTGKLGLQTACPCKPDFHHTSKEEIEKLAKISLPDFVVKGCKETLADFTGDYRGEAEIEFVRTVDDNIFLQIENDMGQESSCWSKRNDDEEYICSLKEPDLSATPSKDEYWRLAIRRDSNLGKIIYGRV
jgi:hypothetical protein